MTGYGIQQKWSVRRRKIIQNKWEIKNLDTNRVCHTSRTYGAAVKWLRKKK